MRGMMGLDVLDKLRGIDKRCLVIIASADIQSSSRELATLGGASAFVNKPFVAAVVLAAVRRVLAGDAE